VIDIGVGRSESPPSVIGVGCKILQHVFVNFLLQVDSDTAVNANDFVRANASVRGYIAVGVRCGERNQNDDDSCQDARCAKAEFVPPAILSHKSILRQSLP
jgi:hypothetical protein